MTDINKQVDLKLSPGNTVRDIEKAVKSQIHNLCNNQRNKTLIQDYIGLTRGTKMKIVSNPIRPNTYVSILECKLPKYPVISLCMCLPPLPKKCKVRTSLVIIES